MNKKEAHVVTGMVRDMSAAKFNPNFVFDAHNIRITARGKLNSLLAVTNEKGTEEIDVTGDALYGLVIGSAVFPDTVVLFTTETENEVKKDRIYRLTFNADGSVVSKNMTARLGADYLDLNFDAEHPLETYPLYETSEIKKVYWVDGINQTRVINICNEDVRTADSFNFAREVALNHTMTVTKSVGGGQFPAGEIQYCFAYFNKFGQQTAIVECSPMYYLSPVDKGLPADGSSNATFTIELTNLDPNFKYVRIYSIISTSEGSVQSVRIVGDYQLQERSSIVYSEILPGEGGIIPDSDQWWGIGPILKEDLCIKNTTTGEILYDIDTVYSDLQNYATIPNSKIFNTFSGCRFFNKQSNRYYVIDREWNDESGIIEEDVNASIAVVDRGNYYYITYVSIPEYSDQFFAATTDETTYYVIAVDSGTHGVALDATALLFIGGESFIPKTMAVKDNVLFLGNIEEDKKCVGELVLPNQTTIKAASRALTVSSRTFSNETSAGGRRFYNYRINNNLGSFDSKSFKAGENYRLGFIAQDKNGKWSDAIWINDVTETKYPSIGGVVGEICRAGFATTLTTDIVNTLFAAGYKRVAPVAVYPNAADRQVVCQGILSGTVYNVEDRCSNSPFAQADWRFRPGYSWKVILDEIQTNAVNRWADVPANKLYHDAPDLPATKYNDSINEDFENRYKEYFYRDPSILTFHSPDIEHSDSLLNSDLAGLKLRVVGISNGGTAQGISSSRPEQIRASYESTETQGYSGLSSVLSAPTHPIEESEENGFYWEGYLDTPVEYVTPTDQSSFEGWRMIAGNWRVLYWKTYLWHRHGSLSNAYSSHKSSIGDTVLPIAKLKTKCASELMFGKTVYFPDIDSVTTVPIEDAALFSEGAQMLQLNYQGNLFSYYGNIDRVLNINVVNNSSVSYDNSAYYDSGSEEGIVGADKRRGYPIEATRQGPLMPELIGNPPATENSYDNYIRNHQSFGKDAVRIRYSSTKHVVLSAGTFSNNVKSISNFGENLNPSSTKYMYWSSMVSNADNGVTLDNVPSRLEFSNYNTDNSIFIGELYREFTPEQSNGRFGGNSDEALTLNDWKVCGKAEVLSLNETCTIQYSEGDTYVGRYDFLKTYPTSPEDENSVVSIYSTELESRVNLNLRYDKNRGLTDNTLVTPENFNLFNRPGYEQTNRYFTYHSLDYDKFNTTHFPNMVTWSLEKTLGEEIDTWTEMSMMSTFDMEGSLGEITKLATFGNELFGFQQNGIAQVLYNSRVQIPTSDGQPIEITNGLKYGGLRYISRTVGLTNKWSMAESPLGLYFVDDTASTLYRFTGQLADVSTSEGFNTWFSEVCSHTVWNPKDFGNIKSFYDKANKDVYFVTKDTALVFSEQLGKFTSFMDYSKATDMFSVGNRYFAIRNTDAKIWQLWKGKYNSFFGEFKPFWITFVSNDGQTTDKVYDTLEWRTQSYHTIAGNTAEVDLSQSSPFSTFDTLRVWNDHQDTLDTPLIDTKGKSYNLKKKFNVFRALVPRDKSSYFASFNRDRIRNPWTFIKLGRALYNEELLVFNDLVVNYFE